MTSIKSVNSDEDFNSKPKIILDETVNPKRPLRPNRLHTQNSTSSPSNSNQSSRPISHISGEEYINSNNALNYVNSRMVESLMQEEGGDSEIDKSLMKPPPKPPKPTNIKLKVTSNNSILQTSNNNIVVNSENGNSNGVGFQSIENLIKSNQNESSSYDQTKSSTSLNSILFTKQLTSKTTSDSILNRV